MITAFVAAAWWAVARRRLPVALGVLSLVALGLAAITLVAEGLHWQLVPWQLVATACAAAAALHLWRPGLSLDRSAARGGLQRRPAGPTRSRGTGVVPDRSQTRAASAVLRGAGPP